MWGTEDQELVTVADAPTPNPNPAEDWERWPAPRDRNRWKAEVRDRWVPWLRGLPHATVIIGNDAAFWTRVGETENGVSFWTSGLNTVADTVLCKLHDDFSIYENVITNPFIPATPEPFDV
jgi:hypothetical protein